MKRTRILSLLAITPLSFALLQAPQLTAAATEPTTGVEEVATAPDETATSTSATPYIFNPNGSLDVAATVAAVADSIDGTRAAALAEGLTAEDFDAHRADSLSFVSVQLSNPDVVALIVEPDGTGSDSSGEEVGDLTAASYCNYSAYRTWARGRFFGVPTFSNHVIEGPFSCRGDVPLVCTFYGAVAFAVPPVMSVLPGSGLLRYNYGCFAEATSIAGVRPTIGRYGATVVGGKFVYNFTVRPIVIT